MNIMELEELKRKYDELVKFVCEQSVNAFESDCRKRAINEMGYSQYIAWLIDSDNSDYMNEDDKTFIIEKLRSAV